MKRSGGSSGCPREAAGATGSDRKGGSGFGARPGLGTQSTDSGGALCPVLPADGDPRPGRLLDDPPQRLRWQAHLEFTHNHDVGDLTWDKIAVSLPRSEKLRALVLAGVPHSMRPQVRPRGAARAWGRGRGLRAALAPPLSCGCGSRGPCRRSGAPS